MSSKHHFLILLGGAFPCPQCSRSVQPSVLGPWLHLKSECLPALFCRRAEIGDQAHLIQGLLSCTARCPVSRNRRLYLWSGFHSLRCGFCPQHGDQSGQARGKHTGCHLHLLLRREPGAHQEHRASLPRRRLEAETSEDEALSQRCAQLLAPNVLLVRGGRHAGEQGCRGGNIFSKRAV